MNGELISERLNIKQRALMQPRLPFPDIEGGENLHSGIVHMPISPSSFGKWVDEWHRRCRFTEFVHADFGAMMDEAKKGDLIDCDPPYLDSQTIVYGAQAFSFSRLLEAIDRCKSRGVYVALSIDGTKRSGGKICNIPIPAGLFEMEVSVNCGRSMLRRFQMAGQTLEKEVVSDRLLLTYPVARY